MTEERLRDVPVLRLTGEQIDSITPKPDGDWFVDFDEYEEFVPKRVYAALAATPEPTLDAGDRPEMEWHEAATLYGQIVTALASARLWLVGEYADRPRSEFNGEAWQRLVDKVGLTITGQPGWMHTARTYRIPPASDTSPVEGAER